MKTLTLEKPGSSLAHLESLQVVRDAGNKLAAQTTDLVKEEPAETAGSESLDPVSGYQWAFEARKQQAMVSLASARLADQNGLETQRDMHLADFLDIYHTDLVLGYVIPALQMHFPNNQVVLVRDDLRPGVNYREWRSDDYLWRAVPISEYGEKIPYHALWALEAVKQTGIPFEGLYVVFDTYLPPPPKHVSFQPVRVLHARKTDPYLCGRISRYLVSFAYWL